MKPRWLAFALTLPTDDVLFVQYTVPTIVMSRQCDQHNKVSPLSLQKLFSLRDQQFQTPSLHTSKSAPTIRALAKP